MEHQALLETYLHHLHLSTFLHNYQAFAQDAARTDLPYERYLLALCEQEVAQRDASRIERCISGAHFPLLKELGAFEFSAVDGVSKQKVLELAQGRYLSTHDSIILIGNPGLGKTHIATGLGMAACRQGKRVRFYNVAKLIDELQAAKHDLRLSKFMAQVGKHELVILDELGFIPFTKDGAQLLFQLCSELYERVAMIVTTNLKFADWNSLFGDERLTAALLDRLTHKSHIVEFLGESYRFRQRLQHDQRFGPSPIPDSDSGTPQIRGEGCSSFRQTDAAVLDCRKQPLKWEGSGVRTWSVTRFVLLMISMHVRRKSAVRFG